MGIYLDPGNLAYMLFDRISVHFYILMGFHDKIDIH